MAAVGYHPGTVETVLSGEMGENRELECVFIGDKAIEKMMRAMSSLKKENSGTGLDWDGKQTSW